MPSAFGVLLDQNVPRSVGPWLKTLRPSWDVRHTSDVSLDGRTDQAVFAWAQGQDAIVVTFDEDFADQRSFPAGQHHGIVRLRVWPTTIEETQRALARLLDQVSEEELRGALVIVGREHIRIRSSRPLKDDPRP